MRVGVFAFDHTGAVLLWGLSAVVWGAGGQRRVWLGGSEAGWGVFRPERRQLPLSVRVVQFSRVTGVALLCLTWNKDENYTLNAKIRPLRGCFNIHRWNILLCSVFAPFPSMAGLNCPFWGTRLWYVCGESWYPVCGCSTVRLPSAHHKEN